MDSHSESLDPELVQGYLRRDPEAIALVAFVAANAGDPTLSGEPTSAAAAASYINPLADADSVSSRTLLFEIEVKDLNTEERHSYTTAHEGEWRKMLKRLEPEHVEVIPMITVLFDVPGAPRGFAAQSAPVRAA